MGTSNRLSYVYLSRALSTSSSEISKKSFFHGRGDRQAKLAQDWIYEGLLATFENSIPGVINITAYHTARPALEWSIHLVN